MIEARASFHSVLQTLAAQAFLAELAVARRGSLMSLTNPWRQMRKNDKMELRHGSEVFSR